MLVAVLGACQLEQQTPKSLEKQTQAQQYSIGSELAEDEKLNELLSEYRSDLTEKMDVQIGASTDLLKKGLPESKLGNLVCDLILERAETEGEPVDFAVLNNGGFRNVLPKGDLKVRHVFEMMPFDNELVVLTLAPKQMEELMKYIAYGKGVPQSGMNITIAGGKVKEAYIGGEAWDKDKTYRVVTSDYLAEGGSRMSFFEAAESRVDLGILLRDAILEYIEKQEEPISPQEDGRIEIL